MKVTLTTMVMIQNSVTLEVLAQDRKKRYPGISFPGGKLDPNESFYQCAVREIKEETGLNVKNLKLVGMVHWFNTDNHNRYICALYKTTDYSGELVVENDEGRQFWISIADLHNLPDEKLTGYAYPKLPMFYDEIYKEAFIPWSGDDSDWDNLKLYSANSKFF